MDADIHIRATSSMRRIANQIIHIVQAVQTITDNKIQRASLEFRKTLPQYPSDNLLVGKKHLGNTVLRERRQLSNEGVIVAVCRVNKITKMLSDNIQIEARGIELREEDIEEVKMYIMKAFSSMDLEKPFNEKEFEKSAAKKVANRMAKLTTQKPVVIPIVIEDNSDIYE